MEEPKSQRAHFIIVEGTKYHSKFLSSENDALNIRKEQNRLLETETLVRRETWKLFLWLPLLRKSVIETLKEEKFKKAFNDLNEFNFPLTWEIFSLTHCGLAGSLRPNSTMSFSLKVSLPLQADYCMLVCFKLKEFHQSFYFLS